jgi:beta-1,2-mannosidase
MGRSYHWKSVFLVAYLAAVWIVADAASTWMLGPFTRPETGSPIIRPNAESLFQDPFRNAPVHWESLHTFNPAAVVRDGRVYVLYRAEDDTGGMYIGGHTSRLGLAISDDGVHFERRPEPVFFPDKDSQAEREWPGGVEDPRIVESDDGTYVLTYTQYNRKTYDVGVATSKDLIHWSKFGPAFQSASAGKYAELRYKSAGIVTAVKSGRLMAAKIDDKYWMYWGEGEVHLATSVDLIHWTPVEDSHGKLIVLLNKRPGRFDSGLPEVGPPPVLTNYGIVLLYNGKNGSDHGDKTLPAGTYSVGQALFSRKDPAELISRTERPFFKPEMPFEKTGQYTAGTTFAEGLVYYNSIWLLYYGCADSFVGVASTPAVVNAGNE